MSAEVWSEQLEVYRSTTRSNLAAGIAQLVEHLLAMQKVASSSLVSRSTHSSAHTLSLVFDFAGTNSLITVR